MTTQSQNIDYYSTLYCSYKDFQTRREKNFTTFKYLRPIDTLIYSMSSKLSYNCIVPAIACTYRKTGAFAAEMVSLKDPKKGKWLKSAWHDPVPTETLLKMGEWIQNKSFPIALRSPIEVPIIYELDKCVIALARHIFIVSKDINTLLKIPQTLRDFVNWETIDVLEEKPAPFVEKTRLWVFIDKALSSVHERLMALIALVIKILGLPFKYLPLTNDLIIKIGVLFDNARNHIHQTVIDKAHCIIDHQEGKIRRKVVSKVAEVGVYLAVHQTITTLSKITLGALAYEGTKYGLTYALGSHSTTLVSAGTWGLRLAALYLFVDSLVPSIERLHNDYKEDFNAEASTLNELAQLINRRNLPKIIPYIRKILS